MPKPAAKDDATSVAELKELVENFVSERDWAQFHTPKNLSMALAIETSELMDVFKWRTESEVDGIMRDKAMRGAVAEELADVLIYALAFANRNRIDVSTAIRRKITKNRRKYPIRNFKGRF